MAVDPACFSNDDYSTISIIIHVECISKIHRVLVVKEGGHGTLAWIDVRGFLDLSLPPSPSPSPPFSPLPRVLVLSILLLQVILVLKTLRKTLLLSSWATTYDGSCRPRGVILFSWCAGGTRALLPSIADE